MFREDNKKKLYSFDVFDTLITRRCATPLGIFALMRDKISGDEELPEEFRENFFEIRINSEKYARESIKKAKGYPEITFEDIYLYIQERYGIKPEKIKYLQNLEIETERENILPVEENISKLKDLVKEGERVVLISDMYFLSGTIRSFLTKFDSVFEDIKIYVSSEYRALKWNGALYQKVKAEENVSYKNWKHLGDNELADFKSAKKLGIKAERYNYPSLMEYEQDWLAKNQSDTKSQLLIGASKLARLNKHVVQNTEKYDLGATYTGMFLYNYVNFIIEQSLQEGFKTLYFVARDGYIPKLAADIIIKEKKLDIKTKYLYGSRAAWRVPFEESYDQIVNAALCEYSSKLSVAFLSERLGVDKEKMRELLGAKDTETVFSENERITAKENLINKQEIRHYILEGNMERAENLLEYLKQEIDLSEDKIAFVEINGGGTTQDTIAKAINKIAPKVIYTFYLSFTGGGCDYAINISKKFILCTQPKPWYYYFELLFRAPHGQTVEYIKGVDGRVSAKQEECFTDYLYEWGYEEYLEGILDFIRYTLSVNQEGFDRDMCYFYFDYMTTKCSSKMASIIGDIPYLCIGKENKKHIAAPKISLGDILKLLVTRQTINDLSECYHLSLVRSFGFLNLLKNNINNLTQQINIFKELKLYFKLKTLKNKKIMFWGASLFLENFIKKYRIKDKNILGIIDKNPTRRGDKFGDYIIYTPDEIENKKPDYILMTIINQNEVIYDDICGYMNKNYPQICFGPNLFSNNKSRTNDIIKIIKENRISNENQKQCSKKLDVLIKNHLKENLPKYDDFIEDLFKNQNVKLAAWEQEYDNILRYYKFLFNKCSYVQENKSNSTVNIFWGSQFYIQDNIELLYDCLSRKKNYVFAEMGFINRIAYPSDDYRFSNGISFVFDDMAPYYDARFSNRLENMLNDKNLVLSEEQLQRAKNCISKIVETNLTKYNYQPIYEPKIGRVGVKKVLVIDQVYGDMSITKGMANDNTFKEMLECAIKENPDADIIVKTHPDTIDGARGYYTKLKQHDNIYTMTGPINPISLIKYADKVYVCTSQFGFEALMCNKEVHIFGMPFYAGWGLAHEHQKCIRRTNKRTLEEVFYITYIMYSYYVNPETQCRCEIEEAMDYILKLRDEYFNTIG